MNRCAIIHEIVPTTLEMFALLVFAGRCGSARARAEEPAHA
jgi:hypothetical protein